ncbi:MAG TPA: thioredoxin, partial [Anaeromyxobacter sp.]|nr:thioredoxin [Anaeromyxobacter sp.]
PVAPPTGGRAALLKRDTVGAFESRLRWSARWRWLAPVLGGALAVVAVAVWLLVARPARRAAPPRTDAMPLLAQDDSASLEQALATLDAAVRRAPQQRSVSSEQALAYVLRAASLVEEGEGLAAAAAARTGERERLAREQPAGWEQAEHAAASDVRRLEADVRAREERARGLGAAAFQALEKLRAEPGEATGIARGLAAYHALGGERDRARKVIHAARERAPADPWLDLAEAWVDARDPDRAARERALIELGTLSVAHPELLRAQYLLARTQAALGRRAEAVGTLDALLARNARHEAARRLRDQLVAAAQPPPGSPAPSPTPPPAAAPAVSAASAPPESPAAAAALPTAPPEAPQRRKFVTHTIPASTPAPSVTVLPPLGPSGEAPEPRLLRGPDPARASAVPSQAAASPGEGAPGAAPAGSAAPMDARSADPAQGDAAAAAEAQPAPSSDAR